MQLQLTSDMKYCLWEATWSRKNICLFRLVGIFSPLWNYIFQDVTITWPTGKYAGWLAAELFCWWYTMTCSTSTLSRNKTSDKTFLMMHTLFITSILVIHFSKKNMPFLFWRLYFCLPSWSHLSTCTFLSRRKALISVLMEISTPIFWGFKISPTYLTNSLTDWPSEWEGKQTERITLQWPANSCSQNKECIYKKNTVEKSR